MPINHCGRGKEKRQKSIDKKLGENSVKGFLNKERCQSGRSYLTRNQMYRKRYRGFESLPLRVYNFHTARVLDGFNEKAAMRLI